MNLVLLGVHYLVFAAAWVAARLNKRFGESNLLVALGLLGVPILGVLTLILLDPSNHAGNGTTGAWYLIFSVVTLGGVPAVSLASAAVSGVCAFRFCRWVRGANRPDAAPLASPPL